MKQILRIDERKRVFKEKTLLHKDSRRASSKRGSEVGGIIKGVYSRFILAGLKSPNFISSQEYSKVDAHGYVFTYPGSFYALTGMEWVWGINISA